MATNIGVARRWARQVQAIVGNYRAVPRRLTAGARRSENGEAWHHRTLLATIHRGVAVIGSYPSVTSRRFSDDLWSCAIRVGLPCVFVPTIRGASLTHDADIEAALRDEAREAYAKAMAVTWRGESSLRWYLQSVGRAQKGLELLGFAPATLDMDAPLVRLQRLQGSPAALKAKARQLGGGSLLAGLALDD